MKDIVSGKQVVSHTTMELYQSISDNKTPSDTKDSLCFEEFNVVECTVRASRSHSCKH